MVKKVLTYIGLSLLTIALGAYFYFAMQLQRRYADKEVCREIKVTLLDSAQNRFVTKTEVIDIIENFLIVKAYADVFEVDNNWIVFQLCSPFPTDRYSWDLTEKSQSAPP